MDLLPIQEYFFNQINADDFSQHFILKSKEKLDINALQESFDELCNVHDMLRAKYGFGENGDVIQEILPVNTRICDINEYNISENFEESLKEIYIKSSNSLSIQNKLIEINLIHHNNESYLMFIIHHLIVDGVSWNILITDLTNIYTNLKQGRTIELLRPYPYRNWVDDVKDLAKNISHEERQHWRRINQQIDDSDIKGSTKLFTFDVDVNYDVDNLLMLSEEEYWALAIARAYKKTYGADVIFNRESHGRDESIAKLNRTVGWFTSQYPILINTNNKNDDISIINEVYNIKTALKDVDHLGLNYSSLIYTTKEMEFRHCPVTFNFLSDEFTFKNELFESYVPESTPDDITQDSTSYGITVNIVHNADSYGVSGDYADNTYIGDGFNTFIENIKSELEFLGNYKFKDNNIVCCLSESQLGVYLDEKVHEKDTAYSIPGIFEYGDKYAIDEVKDAIHAVINKHPILKGRILDTENMPLFICDSYPPIEIINTTDHSNLIKPFNLDKSLARFYIVDNKDEKFVCYDMHHIISDATSRTIINRELQQALTGKLDASIDLGFVYASRDSFESAYDYRYESAREFFHNEFADIDETQPLLKDINGKTGSVSLPIRGIRKNIESFSQDNNITIGSLLNSVFAYAYSRFTGSDKVYYNFTEHGRHENYSQNALGMFIRTIPIIAKCENKSIKDYLANMSDLIMKSMTNSIYPFRLLAREFDLSNDVAFEYNYDLNDFDMGNDLVVSDDADGVNDFLCVVNDLEDGFVVTVSHLDKFSQHTAKQFVKVFKEVLVQFSEKEKLEDINYISDEDIKLLDSYNKTEHSLVYDDVLDAFNDNLAKYPKNNLVTYKNNIYTYDEGAFIANEIANNLKDIGIKKGDNVAFLVERSELYMFSVLGILSAGSAYVPLDDALPDERIKFMIEDTDAKAIIVSDETYSRAEELSEEIKLLNISNIIKEPAGTSSRLDVTYGDLACILYTSGTTGQPKGVKITRKSTVNLGTVYHEKYALSNDDVYGLFSTIGFDAALLAMTAVLYSGACLSIVPEYIRLDINALNDYYIKQRVTHTLITSQVGRLFVQGVKNTSLDVLLVGGEKLGEIENPDRYLLVDAFGPTESCVFISSIINSNKIDSSSVGPLNYNTKAYILDDECRRISIGAVGELYLAGYQIADKYINRPEESTKAFINNPFDDAEGYEVLYRTGDMVRLLPDGSLGIVGRRDSQVKIRGNRVELTEIEYEIRNMDNIEDVTVQTITNNKNNELIAYIVLSEGSKEDNVVDYVHEHVSKHKPEYMVPSYVVELDEIPLNVNGKVDKSALPDVDVSSLQAEYVAPTNETEKHIINAFEYVFNQKGIGLNDNFVYLGGDSITAIRVVSLLEKNDINCTARDILNYKTPYLIAQNVENVEKISYNAVEGPMDLLPIQEHFFDQINRDDFSQYFILKSKEKLDMTTLQESFDELCNVHDMLRAKFIFGEKGEAIQDILPVNTRICEISEHEITENFEEVLKEIYIESSKALNIENKLMEINLIHHNNESYIMFIIHHLIIDGVSWNILITDFTKIYTNLKQERKTELSRPYPYKNWVEDVKGLVKNISYEEKQHWMKISQQIDETTIKGKTKLFSFDVDVNYNAGNLLMMSEEEYWALAIARAYKKTFSTDVIFNRESHGRDESIAKINRTIGWFTSQYPILINTNNKNDDISIMSDIYNIKTALKNVYHLGLNYSSLIYTTKELEFKHCPVTFNFLSDEFTFKNELFESYTPKSTPDNIKHDSTSYGITFNIIHNADSYIISGDYADNTYISDGFNTFIENIKSELEFLGNYEFNDNNIVCCLSESQLGVYLDEKVHEKDTAYSAPGIFEYGDKYTVDEVKDAIHALINKHPILKGRILDTENMPLLICDSYPSIEIINATDYSNPIKPFNLDKSLARFYIVDNKDEKFVFYDMHHIISDATTRTIINRELHQALIGKLDDSIDLGFVYASRDSFESRYDNRYESAREFFHDEFADIDETQPLLKDINGKTGSVSLPIRGIHEKVELFVQEKGITVGNLLNSVFAYTYSRFTGSDKVYYNFTEHGRHENYVQNAVGMFVQTIPIIANCENKSIKDYLTNMSDLIMKSMTNSIYPFRLLAKEFNLNNNVVFEYNYDLNDFISDDEFVVSDDADGVSDFLCVVNDLEDGFVVTVSHLDKFSQHTAKQFVKVFKEVLVQFLEKENLGDIDYISTEDIELLNDYNQTEHPLVHNDILDAFNDNLLKHENNVLVGYNNRNYTHGQGAFIANEIADILDNLGVLKQDYVALFVNRSEWFLLASMGVLSVGGIYVPIDTSYPDERIIFMLEDTKSKVVIVDKNTEQHMKNIIDENDLDIDVFNVSDIAADNIQTSNHLNSVEVDDEDIACVLYTSGTTGVPKGVLVTRKAINNFVSWYVDETSFTSSDVYGMHCSYVFDIHTAALYSPIITGGSLYVVPEDIRLDLKALNDYYVEHGCTHTYITSQVGKLFAESGMETTIKLLCFGGMKLGELNAPDSIGPFESYGPSENLAISTSIFANKRIHHSSIGRFISNVKGYVLDKELRRVPLGAVGELYLAGNQLTPGYLNRNDENNNAFFDNPFDDQRDYNRIYKTGDIVRFLPDGTLGIIGRHDSQVKIRGNRVELTEVESSIKSMDIVEDVTVQTTTNNGNNELVAYVVINNDLDGDELKDSICGHVNAHKPEYMVPSYVVKLDAIPLNVNGKVDKRALPEVDRTSLQVEYVAPRNENEKEIVEAFKKALNLEKVGIYDDFIRLGGDSLTAIRLLSYIKSNDVTMADIFTFRTPEAIAKNMQDFTFDLDIYSLESGCPLNAAQLNVFADVTIYNKRNAYHIQGYIPIPKEHSLEDILATLDEMLNVHPVLGMRLSDRFEVNDADDIGNLDIISDLITTAKKFEIKDIMNIIGSYGLKDMGGLYNMIKTIIRLFKGEYPYMVKGEKPQISVKSEVDTDTIIDFFTESLDIYNNLSKFLIVETEESYYLFYVIHHIIFDAVSAGVFKHDFELLLDGGSVSLDDTFLKASAYTQQIKNTDKFEEASEYYYPILSSIDDVGMLLEDNSSEGYSRLTWDLKFDKMAFKSFLNNAGISENVLFTGVFAYALSQFVDGDKVLFTMIENGRDRFNGNFIGMTSNVMPLVADCKDRSIDSFMKDMADAVYGISRHSYYPILLLYQKYNFEVNTLFQFVPNWIADDFNNVEGIEDIDSEEIVNNILNSYGDNITEFFVEIYQYDENYRLIITNSNKYSNKLIEDFKDTYISILSNIINTDIYSNLNTTLK